MSRGGGRGTEAHRAAVVGCPSTANENRMVNSGASVFTMHVKETEACIRLHRYATSEITIAVTTGAIWASKRGLAPLVAVCQDAMPRRPSAAESSCCTAAIVTGNGKLRRISLVEMEVTAELRRRTGCQLTEERREACVRSTARLQYHSAKRSPTVTRRPRAPSKPMHTKSRPDSP